MRSPLAALLFVSFCSSCGPSAHEKRLQSARQAERNQQWVQAALEYGAACRMDPAQVSICQRAQDTRDYAVEFRSYQALAHCKAGALSLCLQTIAPVREFRTTKSEKIREVLASASETASAQCTLQNREEGAPGLLTQFACLQQWREPLWEDPGYQKGFIAHARESAQSLVDLAQRSAKYTGAQVAFLEAAQCIAPLSSAATRQKQFATDDFLRNASTELRIFVRTNSKTNLERSLCQELSSRLGRGLDCNANGAHALDLESTLLDNRPRWTTSRWQETKSKRYLAGTERVVNPEYDKARLEYEMADAHVRDAREEANDRGTVCSETEDSSDCSRHESALRTLEQREDELERARSRFHNEPQTIERDVYKDHQYTVTTHTWKAPFRVSVAVGDTVKSRTFSEAIHVVYTDVEHAGFSPANIQTDPFEPPGEDFFLRKALGWHKGYLEQLTRAEMDRRGREAVDTCQESSVQCWTTGRYWMGSEEFGLALAKNISHSEKFRCTHDLIR